jgi:hypothetical protein
MTRIYQHIAFSLSFINTDTAAIVELQFSGVKFYAEDEEDPKDVAILHVAFNVVHKPEVIAEYGHLRPIPKTFKLFSVHVPSDQHL